jgi:hypothetical protein
LELGFPLTETEDFFDVRTETFFDVKAVSEIESKNNSDAYYSIDSSRLSVPNVEMAGEQWILNLGLASDGSRFLFDSALLPTLDADGKILEVEYIDNLMEHYTYRFDEDGEINTIVSRQYYWEFLDEYNIRVYANYGIRATDGGVMSVDEWSSAGGIARFFVRIFNEHLSEASDNTSFDAFTYSEPSRDFPALANALSIPSWVYACASVAASTNSWEAVVQACDSPAN